jgi:hypothetical protein
MVWPKRYQKLRPRTYGWHLAGGWIMTIVSLFVTVPLLLNKNPFIIVARDGIICQPRGDAEHNVVVPWAYVTGIEKRLRKFGLYYEATLQLDKRYIGHIAWHGASIRCDLKGLNQWSSEIFEVIHASWTASRSRPPSTPIETLRDFGLLGTWAPGCNQKVDHYEGFFVANNAPRATFVTAAARETYVIKNATSVADEFLLLEEETTETTPSSLYVGYRKMDGKIRLWWSTTADGRTLVYAGLERPGNFGKPTPNDTKCFTD